MQSTHHKQPYPYWDHKKILELKIIYQGTTLTVSELKWRLYHASIKLLEQGKDIHLPQFVYLWVWFYHPSVLLKLPMYLFLAWTCHLPYCWHQNHSKTAGNKQIQIISYMKVKNNGAFILKPWIRCTAGTARCIKITYEISHSKKSFFFSKTRRIFNMHWQSPASYS